MPDEEQLSIRFIKSKLNIGVLLDRMRDLFRLMFLRDRDRLRLQQGDHPHRDEQYKREKPAGHDQMFFRNDPLFQGIVCEGIIASSRCSSRATAAAVGREMIVS